MKRVAKTIRIITVAPIMALILINALFFFKKGSFINVADYCLAIFSLVILPLLAYPVQNKYNIINKEKRTAQRILAIIFSIVGYILGFILSLILKLPVTQKIVYFTYLLSGVLIAFFSFVLKVNASGHMCGLSGPIATMVYAFGPYYIFLFFFLAFVIWSSLKLNRHSLLELILGSMIPIASLIVSIIIFV
ncbi:MAG: hypothetical protein PHV87_07620 [Bacilli bacterium]|nr:hypothetical protein [Bacilli bacterium]